jgi:cell division transport system ATP-binding protein
MPHCGKNGWFPRVCRLRQASGVQGGARPAGGLPQKPNTPHFAARGRAARLKLPALFPEIPLSALRLDRCCLSYPGQTGAALSDISFAAEPGEFRWLLGPSGSGKTSLLKILALNLRPSAGQMMVLGAELTRMKRAALPALRRRIGTIYQDFRLLSHLSVFDNVALPLRLAGRPEGTVRADVIEMLRWVGLDHRLDALPATLSGGEQQRAGIARAVIMRPALLLADEPTGNLDAYQAERLMLLLTELNRLGTTVIFATHNVALCETYPAPLLLLEAGRLVAND